MTRKTTRKEKMMPIPSALFVTVIAISFLGSSVQAGPKVVGKPKALKVKDPAGGVTPVFSHDGEWLAVKASKSIHYINIQRPRERKVFKVDAHLKRFDILPDSKGFVYSMEDENMQKIWFAPIDGSEHTEITEGPHDYFPSTLKDGKHFVFQRRHSDRYEWGPGDGLYITDLKGSFKAVCSHPDGTDRSPLASPDGRMIAFISEREGNDPCGLYVAEAKPGCSGLLRISDTGCTIGDYSWSPDGKHIAIVKSDELWIANNDGSDLRKLSSDARQANRPAWSPDSKYIVFLKFVRRGKKYDQTKHTTYMSMVEVSTGKTTNLTSKNRKGCHDGNPAWSPLGNHIAYISNSYGKKKKNEVYLLRLKGI